MTSFVTKPAVTQELPSVIIEDFVMQHFSNSFEEEFTEDIPPVQIIDRMAPGPERQSLLDFFRQAWKR